MIVLIRSCFSIMVVILLSCGLSQNYDFVKLSPDTPDPNGNNIEGNCEADYPDATASMDITQGLDATDVTIIMSDAQPNTLFTVWVWLKAKDSSGETFGGNPISGKSGAPLAPSSAYEELLAATGSGNGVTEGANVFTTDENGNAVFSTSLDFPLFGGAYPFHKIKNFDPSDPRLLIENARAYPVPIVSPSDTIDAPFMLRIASHCSDGMSHGWSGSAREPWFDFPE